MFTQNSQNTTPTNSCLYRLHAWLCSFKISQVTNDALLGSAQKRSHRLNSSCAGNPKSQSFCVAWYVSKAFSRVQIYQN
jgi:hypothetical protein